MTKTILLIDDDPIFCFLFEKLFDYCGFEHFRLLIIHDAEEAMTYLNTISVTGADDQYIVFLDINMPFLSGWEFLKCMEPQLRQHSDHIFIYILSSSIAQKDRDKFHENSYLMDFITKPITVETLQKIMQLHQ